MFQRLFRLGDEARVQRDEKRLRAAVQTLQAADDDGRLSALAGLVAWLRPPQAETPEPARQRLQRLTELMRVDAGARAALRHALLWLVLQKQPLRLLSDSGVLTGEGLFSGLWRRMTQGLLPEELDPAQLKDAVSLIFRRDDDYLWVAAIDDAQWVALLDALDLGALGASANQAPPLQILEAMLVVSYRIAALGLEPELVRNHPAIERYESPFLTQNVEMRQFIDELKAAQLDKRAPTTDDKHMLVLLDQCEQIIGKVRKQAAQTGASVSLTVLLARLAQNIARLKLMLQLLEGRPVHELNELRVRFFKQIVRAENRRNHVAEMWSQTVDLLSTRIVSNASKAGEQYITNSRAEFFALFRSAMGAGLIVVIASLAKIALFDDSRSPIGQALVYNAVYVSAFVLMYVFHFSLATKQPAMTAHAIAQTLEGNADSAGKRMAALADLVVRTFRSQFIALLGNLIVVVPLALYVAQVYWWEFDRHYVDAHKSAALLAEVEPLSPLVWFWAALTGVCLFATGLISGYYDNRAAYDRVPQRVAKTRWIRRLLGKGGATRLGAYIENNFGGLMGSILFGIMLGSFGAVGRIFGLPIDTLHVTFTSANTVYALSAATEPATLALSAIGGIAIIGLLNLLVSFALALYVAMRAQRVRFDAWRALLRALAVHAWRRPLEFFWPPREVPAPAAPAADAEDAPAPRQPEAR
ncbi:MAG TPA: RNA methyltransferase [Fontimonas sp.]